MALLKLIHLAIEWIAQKWTMPLQGWAVSASHPTKDYIWISNEHRSMKSLRKKEAATCSMNGAVATSIKLVQNYILTQLILQTLFARTLSFVCSININWPPIQRPGSSNPRRGYT